MKSIGIGISLALLANFTTCIPMISYSVIVFEKMGTTIDPYVSSIVVALALTSGALISSYFADIFGRKMLNTVSFLGSAIGLFATAFCHYSKQKGYDFGMYAWIPIMSLTFVIFISSAGIMSLLYVSSVEYLPAKVCRFSKVLIVLKIIE